MARVGAGDTIVPGPDHLDALDHLPQATLDVSVDHRTVEQLS